MKFNCGPTRAQRIANKEQWHSWFAWHPVRAGNGQCVWLERVERKGKYECTWADCNWFFEYRLAKQPPQTKEHCGWAHDEDGNWLTDCGEVFVLIDGGLFDNGMKFCCYCGKRITQGEEA